MNCSHLPISGLSEVSVCNFMLDVISVHITQCIALDIELSEVIEILSVCCIALVLVIYMHKTGLRINVQIFLCIIDYWTNDL